jgi:homoisocitrate dehydrogenase
MPDLCVIEGDGIGKEVIPAAVSVLRAVVPDLRVIRAEAGWETFQQRGVSVPPETLDAVRECRAGLFGAVSSPSRKVEGYRSAILTLRQELDLYANLRPVRSLACSAPGQPRVDFLIVRENTEGLYVGRERREGDTAVAERVITRGASRRTGRRAVELARERTSKRLTIVHKANILPVTDGLFRDSVREAWDECGGEASGVLLDEMLVDTAAFQIASRPEQFDVIVTTNLFGDILSDLAAIWCGGMGMAPSLNWGEGMFLAEPVHGSAPDIAGKGIANPTGAILSAALLARYAWGLETAAGAIETALDDILRDGPLPPGTPTDQITGGLVDRINRG